MAWNITGRISPEANNVQGALQYKGYSIPGCTIQGRRIIHDQYKLMCFDTILWRTIQDRAPPLTHRRPVRVNLWCSAPCTRMAIGVAVGDQLRSIAVHRPPNRYNQSIRDPRIRKLQKLLNIFYQIPGVVRSSIGVVRSSIGVVRSSIGVVTRLSESKFLGNHPRT